MLPLEIQLCILERLIESHDDSDTSKTGLSIYACVCKPWQLFVEKTTFHHLTLRPSDIQDFGRLAHARRRGCIKHILLEITIEEYGFSSPHSPLINALTAKDNNVLFTKVIRHLWEVLSSWRNHRVTVELGILSSFETEPAYPYYRGLRRAFSRSLGHGRSEAPPLGQYTEYLNRFQDAPADPSLLDIWSCEKWLMLGASPLEFELDGHRLPSAEVITRLLVRRRYFRNIGAKSLSIIFKATPRIEVIHLERWCYGRRSCDAKWDKDSALLGHELPLSLKRFSFYEEFSTVYHQQPRKMSSSRSNTNLLGVMVNTSSHLEHIAISFAVEARHFFSLNPHPGWELLQTVALTSSTMVSRSSVEANELLWHAAQAARGMPKLQTLEIWYCRAGEGGIFRYDKSYGSRNIIWQSTWSFCLSNEVVKAWRGAIADPEEDRGGLGVKVATLPSEAFANFRNVFSYLKLKEHILDNVSWTQV